MVYLGELTQLGLTVVDLLFFRNRLGRGVIVSYRIVGVYVPHMFYYTLILRWFYIPMLWMVSLEIYDVLCCLLFVLKSFNSLYFLGRYKFGIRAEV